MVILLFCQKSQDSNSGSLSSAARLLFLSLPPSCYNIITTHLYFVRSGHINIVEGQFRNLGIGGHQWSSLATSKRTTGELTPSAYIFTFTMNVIRPSGGTDARWLYLPLRAKLKHHTLNF